MSRRDSCRTSADDHGFQFRHACFSELLKLTDLPGRLECQTLPYRNLDTNIKNSLPALRLIFNNNITKSANLNLPPLEFRPEGDSGPGNRGLTGVGPPNPGYCFRLSTTILSDPNPARGLWCRPILPGLVLLPINKFRVLEGENQDNPDLPSPPDKSYYPQRKRKKHGTKS